MSVSNDPTMKSFENFTATTNTDDSGDKVNRSFFYFEKDKSDKSEFQFFDYLKSGINIDAAVKFIMDSRNTDNADELNKGKDTGYVIYNSCYLKLRY